MPALVFGNAATVLQLNQAFLGSTPSNLIYNNQLATVASQGASTFAIGFGTQFVPQNPTDAAAFTPLATSILTNLNLTAPTIAADKAAELVAALPQLLFANRDAIGQVVLNLTNILRNLESDPNWGAAASAYNQQQVNALNYSSNTANTTATATNALTLVGQTYTMTPGFDALVGTAGNDTFNAPTATALGALDSVNGGAGRDVLNVFGVDKDGAAQAINLPTTTNVTNVEVANFAAAGTLTADTSGWTGLEILNVSQAAGAVTLTAAATTAVAVAQAAAAVTVTGGSTQAITSATQGGAINLSKAAGGITVGVTTQGTQTITVNDGTNVAITTGGALAGATQGAIAVGGTKAPSGTVSITNAVTNAAGADATGAAVTVTGGTTVTVAQTASQAVATTAVANNTITQGAVTVNATAATTAVTVTQSTPITAVTTVLPVTGVTEVNTVTFFALTVGQTAVLGGLTITAPTGGMTKEQVAAAFASLDSGARQGYSAVGTYSGTFDSGWTSAAASGDTVVFTRTSTGAIANLAAGGTGTNPSVVETTAGVTAVTAAGRGAITGGAVTVQKDGGGNAAAVTSVTLSGYANSTVSADGLTSLSLSNSNSSLTVNNATAGTLGLTLAALGTSTTSPVAGPAAVVLPAYKTLNVTTATANSSVNVTAAAVETLTVAGTNAFNSTGSTLSALKTVTVSGSAGLTLAAPGTLESLNASGTTGNLTVTAFDATKATYTGGAGTDTLTLGSTTVTKAVSMGAGNDRVNLAASTTAITAAVQGGDGTDTVNVLLADAVTFAGGAQFLGNVTGFEVLGINGHTGAQTLDISKLGAYNSVNVLSIPAAAATTTLDGFTSGGTLTVSNTQTAHASTIEVKAGTAWDTPTTDTFTVSLSNSSANVAGVAVTVAKVETLNLVAADADTSAATGSGRQTHTGTITAADATSMTITGDANLALTLTGSTKLATINGSAMTGSLTVTSTSTVDVTITGGAGADALTAATGSVAHTLIGGAGADTLTANAGLSVLTGGAGFDTFVIAVPSTNVNTYSTITDATKGDYIRFTDTAGAETFSQSKITLAGTAVFQDFANAAIATNTVQGGIAWFQFGGDTFIVQEAGNNTANVFTNGTDLIVRLTGLVDLSLASFDTGAIEIRIG
jgi:S-layer protein